MWKRTAIALLSFFILLGILGLKSPVAYACSCAEIPGMEAQLERKTVIFTGKVVGMRQEIEGVLTSSADPIIFKFEVQEVWKGDLSKHTNVYSAVSSDSCGYTFDANKEYLVFAEGEPERLITGLCEGNKRLEFAQEELIALGTGYDPTPPTASKKLPLTLPFTDNDSEKGYASIVIVAIISITMIFLLGIFLTKRRRR